MGIETLARQRTYLNTAEELKELAGGKIIGIYSSNGEVRETVFAGMQPGLRAEFLSRVDGTSQIRAVLSHTTNLAVREGSLLVLDSKQAEERTYNSGNSEYTLRRTKLEGAKQW